MLRLDEMERFNRAQLLNALATLPGWKQVIFMLLCCERMLPNYVRFSQETGFGNVSVLRDALDAAWVWVESGQLPKDLDALRRACERQAPNTEDFGSQYTSAAVDAANAAATVLDAVESPSAAASLALNLVALAYDTIDMFVESMRDLAPTSPTFEQTILADPLMQNESRCQREDLAELAACDESRHTVVRQMRERANRYRFGSLSSTAEGKQ